MDIFCCTTPISCCRRMSAFGTKRTFRLTELTSAFDPKRTNALPRPLASRNSPAIKAPNGEVDVGSKSDPSEIGHQQPRSRCIEGMESCYRCEDRQPQHNDFQERQVRTVQAEEDWCPGSIQHQLQKIDREWQGGADEAGLPPYQ